MLNFTPQEKQDVLDYYLGQSPDGTAVTFAQKVYVESVLGHPHAVWDIHSNDGRWWVITNPRNLYSQDQFPNMDLALSFHLGLCIRMPRGKIKAPDIASVRPYIDLMNSLAECGAALSQANDPGAFRAIGVRCRENLLAFVHTTQDVFTWPDDDQPQRSNFNAWVDWIFDAFLGGAENRERRRLIKSSLKEAWTYVNWLTHSQSGKWVDAEIAAHTVAHSLGMATDVCIRQFRNVPDECPECGSYRLSPEEGAVMEMPEVILERPVCNDCGWKGEPVPVGERTEEEIGQFITREGENSGQCGIIQAPLIDVRRPDRR